MKGSNLGFLGCDVSKGMCNFELEDEKGKSLESNFQLDDNSQGHKALYKILEVQKKEHGLSKIIIGLESTGGYENNWYKGLRSISSRMGLEVYRINPKLIYHAGKADGKRSITDGISARIISGYLRKNYGEGALTKKRLNQTNDKRAPERTLHKYIQKLLKQNTQSKNRLEKTLYSTMPELLSLKGDSYRNWYLELLIKHPSKSSILKLGIEGLKSIKGLRAAKAEAIYEGLKESVGEDGNKLLWVAIQEEASDILARTKKIDRLKKMLVDELSKDEKVRNDIEIITSVKGIGEDSAVGFLLELGELANYESARNLVAYFGINPTLKQSGDKSYKPRMCKDGSSNARAVIYMMAENVVKHSSYFRSIYRRHRLRGKTHRSALGIIMSKLTRVLFGMLSKQEEFDSGVDQLNQIRKETSIKDKPIKKGSSGANQERRYQEKKEARAKCPKLIKSGSAGSDSSC